MANPSKAKGTAAESRVVEWLKTVGFKDARRNVLGGVYDPADIDPVPMDPPPIIISVKNGYGGKACPSCNHIREVHRQTAQFEKWWQELLRTSERRNAGAAVFLTLKRAGKTDPAYWHWYTHDNQYGVIKLTGDQVRREMQAHCRRLGVPHHGGG